MIAPATTAQRKLLRQLLAKAEYDTRAITPLYRRLGVPDSAQGRSLDAWIDGLNSLEASDYIGKLKKELDDGEG